MKSEESFDAKYYEEIISILPKTPNGVIIELILKVIADFMGHYVPLNGNNLDDYLLKAINLKCPNKLIPVLQNHRQLLYYPDPQLIERVFIMFDELKDWGSMKIFYQAIGRKFYIKKTPQVYEIFVKYAYENKEYEHCVNAFLDILDYKETILNEETYGKIIYSNKYFVKDRIFVELLEVLY